jgi:hypothetical protein
MRAKVGEEEERERTRGKSLRRVRERERERERGEEEGAFTQLSSAQSASFGPAWSGLQSTRLPEDAAASFLLAHVSLPSVRLSVCRPHLSSG